MTRPRWSVVGRPRTFRWIVEDRGDGLWAVTAWWGDDPAGAITEVIDADRPYRGRDSEDDPGAAKDRRLVNATVDGILGILDEIQD